LCRHRTRSAPAGDRALARGSAAQGRGADAARGRDRRAQPRQSRPPGAGPPQAHGTPAPGVRRDVGLKPAGGSAGIPARISARSREGSPLFRSTNEQSDRRLVGHGSAFESRCAVGIVAFGGFESAQAANSVCPFPFGGRARTVSGVPFVASRTRSFVASRTKHGTCFAANSERPGQRRPTRCIVPAFGHGAHALAPRQFPGSFARHCCRERIPANVFQSCCCPPLWAVEMWRVTNRGQRTLRLSADSLPRLLTI